MVNEINRRIEIFENQSVLRYVIPFYKMRIILVHGRARNIKKFPITIW